LRILLTCPGIAPGAARLTARIAACVRRRASAVPGALADAIAIALRLRWRTIAIAS
jgi:hypothetical protein